ncbi:MAG: hypothetical protein ACSLFQ_02090 [Thermoanaerobaculia bacterium]
MKRPFDDYTCRRRTVAVPTPETFEVPSGLYRIAKVAIHGRSSGSCLHTLDIRDRFRDGGSTNKYWFQQTPVTHRCTAKHLLPIVAEILRVSFPKNRVGNIEGTITMTREHAAVDDIATLLVRELPPYLTPTIVDIYHFARADYHGEVFNHDGSHQSDW